MDIFERILLGLAAGAAGGIATFIVQYWWEVKFFFNKNPVKSAIGTWKGKFIADPKGGDGIKEPSSVTVVLNTKLNVLSGEIIYQDVKLGCSGGFFDPRILTLHYWTLTQGVRQHGVLVLELNDNGNTFSGYFLGYGAKTEALVKGTVEVIKQT